MRLLSLLIAGCFVLWLTGCEKKLDNAQRVPIKGTVTLDGKALATGHISFDPQNGEPPAALDILDGKYEGLAPVGKSKVMITSVKKTTWKEETGMDGPGYDEPTQINLLPPRYNEKSEITREVTADGPNEFNFDLKSN